MTTESQISPTRYEVTVYGQDGGIQVHRDVSAEESARLEWRAFSDPAVTRIDARSIDGEQDVAEDEWTPETAHLTADAVIFGDGGAVVALIRRRWAPFEGRWALPGGYVDPGEETFAAARRELEEETGLRVSYLTLAGVYAAPGRDPRGRIVSFAYTATLADTPELVAADDADRAQWVPVSEALAEGLAFDHAAILRSAASRLLPASDCYDAQA
jgi:8-oxo-dGTP diphosphatase